MLIKLHGVEIHICLKLETYIYLTIYCYSHINFKMVTQYIQSKIYVKDLKCNYKSKKKNLLIYTRTALVFIYTTLPLLQKQTKQTKYSFISKKKQQLGDKMYYPIQFEYIFFLTISLMKRD